MNQPHASGIRAREAVLADRLAIERTKMANDRTLLSFVRTSLYFSLAGFSFNQFIAGNNGKAVGLMLIVAAVAIMITGIWRYRVVAKKIRKSIRQVHGYAKLMDEE